MDLVGDCSDVDPSCVDFLMFSTVPLFVKNNKEPERLQTLRSKEKMAILKLKKAKDFVKQQTS